MIQDKKTALNIGVMAHNEEAHIGILLHELLKQAQEERFNFDITVVASGCSDSTEAIVRSYLRQDSRFRLITEQERKGKVSAINLFLSQAKDDLVIIISADVLPAEGTLSRLIKEFSDPAVGLACGRPMPRFRPGFVSSLNSLLWELHHEICLKRPKCGELMALRNIVKEIPREVTTDEAAVEAIVLGKGFKIKYVPEAIIFNDSPASLDKFIKQRIRNFIGHLYIKETMLYRVSTLSVVAIILLAIKKARLNFNKTMLLIVAGCLEVYSRLAARFQFYIMNKKTLIWER